MTKKTKSGKLSELSNDILANPVDERPVPEGYVCRICQESGVSYHSYVSLVFKADECSTGSRSAPTSLLKMPPKLVTQTSLLPATSAKSVNL